ncbi:MAG TPA: response regulator transcription factor, partial [Acidimicrobiales bacterium]|nr:response regulator transcription factor [Acidimicrobiales bacterium]
MPDDERGGAEMEPPKGAVATVLVLEDDNDIGWALSTLFERAGYNVVVVADGLEGLRRFHAIAPDLVILDIGLPSLDGWTVLDRIRELSPAPVLMLTALDAEMDKVRGLRGGADDYVSKPFGNQELLARVEALLRRHAAAAGDATHTGRPVRRPRYDDGEVLIDIDAHRIEVRGHAVDLTPLEFRLLDVLLRHAGNILTTEQILQLAWRDPTATGPDRVKFTVLRLRR